VRAAAAPLDPPPSGPGLVDWDPERKSIYATDKPTEPSPATPALLMTPDQLQRYNGSDPSLPLYLAICGEVFDVSAGRQYYDPAAGGGYSAFAGRDASRAFISGKFAEDGDDLTGLSKSELTAVRDWLKFYQKHETYTYVGRVVGRFFDETGTARRTPLDEVDWNAPEPEDPYPPCNMRWSQSEGSEVWCTTMSGGKERAWVGYPRQYLQQEKEASGSIKTNTKCVCVEDPKSKDPLLKRYPNCKRKAHRCVTETPKQPE
jgi:predicted heme/steroid binding protein